MAGRRAPSPRQAGRQVLCGSQEPLPTRGLVEDPVQAGPLELCLLPVSAEKAKGGLATSSGGAVVRGWVMCISKSRKH